MVFEHAHSLLNLSVAFLNGEVLLQVTSIAGMLYRMTSVCVLSSSREEPVMIFGVSEKMKGALGLLICVVCSSCVQNRMPPQPSPENSIEQAADPRMKWVGASLGDALADLNVAHSTLARVQEPPGKLRAIVVPADANGGEAIEIWLRYEGGPLFSETGTWAIQDVKSAKVRGVKVTKDETVKRYGEVGLGQWSNSR